MIRSLIFLLLAVSLAANGRLLWRRVKPGQATPPAGSVAPVEKPGTQARAGEGYPTAHLIDLAINLRRFGVPREIIEVWIRAQIDELFHDREQALAPPRREKYWQPFHEPSLQTRLARLDLQMEKGKLLEAVLGYDPARMENAAYAHLPLEKQQAVKWIMEEYTARIGAWRESVSNLPTAREEEAMSRLVVEQQQALDPWLSRPEQQALQAKLVLVRWTPADQTALGNPGWVREPTAVRLRRDLRAFDATEQEFVAIYDANMAFEDLRQSMDGGRVQALVDARVRTRLGEERYAAYDQKLSSTYARIADVVARTGHPASRIAEILAVRDRIAADSARIADDPSLSIDEKVASLAALAREGRELLSSMLDGEGAEFLTQMATGWFRPLERGSTIVFSRNGSSSRPVRQPNPTPPR